MNRNALLLVFLTCLSFGQVNGAKVTEVTIDNGKATITVMNVSQHDITGYSLALVAHFKDGHVEHKGYTEDYGPASVTGKALHHGETATVVKDYGPSLQSLDATVVVAIYDDQTADVSDDIAFNNTLATRKKVAAKFKSVPGIDAQATVMEQYSQVVRRQP